jgi:hypothetical protein
MTVQYSSTCWRVTISYTDAVSAVKYEFVLPLRPFLSYMGSCLVCTLTLSFTISNCSAWCKATATHCKKCILWKISKHKFPFQSKCKFTWTASMFKTVKIQNTSISQWRRHIKHLSGSNVPGGHVVLVSIKCDTHPKADRHHYNNTMFCHQRQIFKGLCVWSTIKMLGLCVKVLGSREITCNANFLSSKWFVIH